MKRNSTQQGITLTGLIVACVVIGGAALVGMKLWPVYNEKFKVDLAMDKIAALPESGRMTKASIAKELQKQFDVQDVDPIEYKYLPRLLEVERPKGSKSKYLTMAYEIRHPFFSNLDIVMNYSKTVELGAETTD